MFSFFIISTCPIFTSSVYLSGIAAKMSTCRQSVVMVLLLLLLLLFIVVHKCREKLSGKAICLKTAKEKKNWAVENYVCVFFSLLTFPSLLVFFFVIFIIYPSYIPSSIIYDFLFKANKKERKKGRCEKHCRNNSRWKKNWLELPVILPKEWWKY